MFVHNFFFPKWAWTIIKRKCVNFHNAILLSDYYCIMDMNINKVKTTDSFFFVVHLLESHYNLHIIRPKVFCLCSGCIFICFMLLANRGCALQNFKHSVVFYVSSFWFRFTLLYLAFENEKTCQSRQCKLQLQSHLFSFFCSEKQKLLLLSRKL